MGLTGNTGSRRRRDAMGDSLVSSFNPAAFAAAIASSLNTPAVTSAEVSITNVVPDVGQLLVTFTVLVASQSSGQIVSSLATVSSPPSYTLLRNLVFKVGSLYSNCSLLSTSVQSLAYNGTVYSNPASSALYSQLAQLYQLQDAISRMTFNVTVAAAALDSTVATVEGRFGVGPLGSTGISDVRAIDLRLDWRF